MPTLLVKERRIIGVSHHTREELADLMGLARRGAIDLSRAITRTVPLDARHINRVLDELESKWRWKHKEWSSAFS
jgi:D-arabinose 1-dehydrogenase-like Zn-dependent alcohol dehydrogenase